MSVGRSSGYGPLALFVLLIEFSTYSMAMHGPGVAAVSYTHLDVYKRQTYAMVLP